MQEMHPNPMLVEWGWKTAVGFLVTGLLGILALMLRWIIPTLGERMWRVFGERAFRTELSTLETTAGAVKRMEPAIAMQSDAIARTSEQLLKLEERCENGFSTLADGMATLNDHLFDLAKSRK